MRSISKQGFPATSFIQELETEIANNAQGFHPTYGSTGPFGGTHYKAVLTGLLVVQNGLCAYTESLLSNDPVLLNPAQSFANGALLPQYSNYKVDADIEHYDPELKTDYGWLLSNLFLCRVFINRDIKKSQATLDILKPDNANYNPINYLRYNFLTHRFIANPTIQDNELKAQITNQLDRVLGINSEQIISQRRDVLNRFRKYIQVGLRTYNQIRQNDLSEFFTAYDMSQEDLTAP